MNGTSSNPNDAEAVRHLLAESGVEATQELTDALLRLRETGGEPAPVPCAELEALFTAGVTPLRKSTRRRGFLLGGAVIAAMAAGTTGVAATNHDFWVTAETSHEAPAPFSYEEVPAPMPEPPNDPAASPAAVPAPDGTAQPEPVEEAAADPVPAAPAPAAEQTAAEETTDKTEPGSGANRGWSTGDRGDGHGRAERPGNQWDDDDDDDEDWLRGRQHTGQPGGWQQDQGKGWSSGDNSRGASHQTQPGGGSRNHGGDSAWGSGSR